MVDVGSRLRKHVISNHQKPFENTTYIYIYTYIDMFVYLQKYIKKIKTVQIITTLMSFR